MQHAPMYMSSIAASFARRVLDPAYDSIAEHDIVRTIRSRPGREKLALEALLYGISALIEVRMKDETAVRRFIKSLVTDGASEFGSRLYRGTPALRASEVSSFMDLSEAQLDEFLAWYDSANEETRRNARSFLKRRSCQELSSLLKFGPRNRDRVVSFFTDQTAAGQRRPPTPRRIRWLDRITKHLNRPLFSGELS